MKLVIHGVGCTRGPNIRKWPPEDPDRVFEFILVTIGPRPGRGGDDFTMCIATPLGLAGAEEKGGIVASPPLLVMKRYDYDQLWAWLEATVASCEGETWLDCVGNLRRYFHWEYEGYAERGAPARTKPR